MEYEYLGRTGVRVSKFCFGTMSFGGDADAGEAARMYGACRDLGFNFFDCADGYSKGRAEEILGGLIAGHPGPLPEALCPARSSKGLWRLFAETFGILVYHCELGDRVREGETICHIVDPESRRRTPVPAPIDGLLYARRSHRFTRQGQYFCAIAGDMLHETAP